METKRWSDRGPGKVGVTSRKCQRQISIREQELQGSLKTGECWSRDGSMGAITIKGNTL